MDQERVINELLFAYNGAIGSSYVVSRNPDKDNRDSADIDAYAESPGRQPLAIEHTKIQSLQDQNRDSAWFMRGLGSLESELSSDFPSCFDLVFPYQNVVPGQDWAAIRTAVKQWFLAHAQSLPEGRTTHHIAGVPFPIMVSKRLSNHHKVFLIRQVPPGDIDALLLEEMHRSLGHKYSKLGEYRQAGAASVLVIESEDIALVSEQTIYMAFLRAVRDQPRPDLDQVWLASTYGEDCSVHCLLGPSDVMSGVNPENFRFGPQFVAERLRE